MGFSEQRGRREDRLHVLSGALRAFAEATTDYERLLNVVARTVSDVVADGCIVRLLSDGGWLTPVAFHFPLEAYVADAHAAAEARAFMTAPRNVAEYAWGQRLIETGEAFVLPHVDTANFRAVVTPDVAKVYETIGIHSMLVVVLRLRGESIGTLTLFRFDPGSPPFDEADQEMAQALADHAALSIGIARSYAAERAARDGAERATARFARLSDAGVIGIVVIDLENKRVVDVRSATRVTTSVGSTPTSEMPGFRLSSVVMFSGSAMSSGPSLPREPCTERGDVPGVREAHPSEAPCCRLLCEM